MNWNPVLLFLAFFAIFMVKFAFDMNAEKKEDWEKEYEKWEKKNKKKKR